MPLRVGCGLSLSRIAGGDSLAYAFCANRVGWTCPLRMRTTKFPLTKRPAQCLELFPGCGGAKSFGHAGGRFPRGRGACEGHYVNKTETKLLRAIGLMTVRQQQRGNL